MKIHHISPISPIKLPRDAHRWAELPARLLAALLASLLAASGLLGNAMAADTVQAPAAAAIAEKTAANPAGFGSHGMAVFGGRDGLYASHLPMFHAPHDAQVLLRFHLADAASDAKLRAQLARKPELWTLDPELFDLHRLGPGQTDSLKQFTARFVQGHFERGGKERFAGQTVVVDAVLRFKRLDAKQATTATVAHSAGRYLLVGSGHEFFAVKEIDRRPDFDIIVAMKPLRQALPVAVAHALAVDGVPQFVLATDDLHSPSTASLQAALARQGGAVLQPAKTLYFETEDLK